MHQANISYPVVPLYRSLCTGSNLLYKNFYCHCTHSQGLYIEIGRELIICKHYLYRPRQRVAQRIIPLNWVSHGQSVPLNQRYSITNSVGPDFQNKKFSWARQQVKKNFGPTQMNVLKNRNVLLIVTSEKVQTFLVKSDLGKTIK